MTDSNKGLTVQEILAKKRFREEQREKWKRDEVERVAGFDSRAQRFVLFDPHMKQPRFLDTARQLEHKYKVLTAYR